jgi:hypothetical protein
MMQLHYKIEPKARKPYMYKLLQLCVGKHVEKEFFVQSGIPFVLGWFLAA